MIGADSRIEVSDEIYLSGIRFSDQSAMVKHLESRDVYDTTLNIPHPYTADDASLWIQKRIEHTQRVGREVSFAIRKSDGEMIGVVSSDSLEPGNHRAEIGYWLAPSFWGRGIMTAAVGVFVRYAFEEPGLRRLTAHTLESNVASARVLEKNGFILEARLRKHFQKDGRLLDARLYGLLKENLNQL